MTRHVAFLRAINLGTRRRVAMADLREVFEGLGYDDVSTYLATGNVLFSAAGKATDLEAAIEPALAERFGFEVTTMVRTAAQVRRAVDLDPFGPLPDDHRWFVELLQRRPTAAERRAVTALGGDVEELVVDGADLHRLVRGRGLLASTISPKALAGALGDNSSTNRSSTMLRKLAERL